MPDFDNLPSMHSSVIASNKKKNLRIEPSSMIQDSERSYTEQESYRIRLPSPGKPVKKRKSPEASFLESARQSERSARDSAFNMDGDQSSIHQQIRQDTDMNADDQLGFVVVVNESSAIGVTIESG